MNFDAFLEKTAASQPRHAFSFGVGAFSDRAFFADALHINGITKLSGCAEESFDEPPERFRWFMGEN